MDIYFLNVCTNSSSGGVLSFSSLLHQVFLRQRMWSHPLWHFQWTLGSPSQPVFLSPPHSFSQPPILSLPTRCRLESPHTFPTASRDPLALVPSLRALLNLKPRLNPSNHSQLLHSLPNKPYSRVCSFRCSNNSSRPPSRTLSWARVHLTTLACSRYPSHIYPSDNDSR